MKLMQAVTNIAIPVFDWALKKFSGDGADDDVRAKFLSIISRFTG